MSYPGDNPASAREERSDRLTVFTFLWACQALIQQEFFRRWLEEGEIFGWAVTILGISVLLRPRSMFLFGCMLISSVLHSFSNYPYVANHILVESIANLGILTAMIWTLLERRGQRRKSHESWDTLGLTNHEAGEVFFGRFAPVLLVSFVIVYFFAFLAKLNYDFLVPEVSCAVKMYHDVVNRFPFLPSGDGIEQLAIWGTILIEGAIPFLLLSRRTYPFAFLIALPFHFLLGLIDHRTFSSFAFSLYFVFLSQEITDYVNHWRMRLIGYLGHASFEKITAGIKLSLGVMLSVLVLAGATGYSHLGVGPLRLHRMPMLLWVLWSLMVMFLYFGAWINKFKGTLVNETRYSYASAGFLWLLPALVAFSGLSIYFGLKSQMSFTMYSNLRTEGGRWNHILMPDWVEIGEFQDQLVDIIRTDHPELQRYVDRNQYINYFELRRIASEAREDFTVEYEYQGERRIFILKDGESNDPHLREKHPLLVAKLLRFRPVSKGEHMECFH